MTNVHIAPIPEAWKEEMRARLIAENYPLPTSDEFKGIEIPPNQSHKPVVYYLSGPGLGVVKIGTTNNMARRLRQMQRQATGLNPLLLAWEYGGDHLENQRHMDFGRDSRIRTDWFALTPRLRGHIASIRVDGFPEVDA